MTRKRTMRWKKSITEFLNGDELFKEFKTDNHFEAQYMYKQLRQAQRNMNADVEIKYADDCTVIMYKKDDGATKNVERSKNSKETIIDYLYAIKELTNIAISILEEEK